MKIIFMGTPEFAVATLRAIHASGHEIVAVITAPDKPAGRGLILKASPVKIFAEEHHIAVLQPERLKNPEFISQLKSYEADLGIVVAFRMLPEVVWAMFPKGTFNVHASLLPQYRGAAPINHAIINGEKITGVSTFFLQHEIDTGKIIACKETPIEENETAGELHDRLMHLGAELALETIKLIENNQVAPEVQKESEKLKAAPKIFKAFCKIDFQLSADKVHDFIRGLSPFPGAYAIFNLGDRQIMIKILKSEVLELNSNQKETKIESDGKTFLRIYCSKGSIKIIELQPEGKKRMGIESFLNGFKDWNSLNINP